MHSRTNTFARPYTPPTITGKGTELYLDPPDFDAAVRLGQAMDATVGGDYKNDPNGKFAVSDRYVLGMLGEYAFAKFLRNYGVRFDWNPQATGKSDNGDFIVYWDGKPVTIDVKTLRGHRQSLLVSEREYEKGHTNWRYVVVRQGGGSGRYFTIEGMCKYQDLWQDTFDDGSKVWKCELADLKSIGYITTYCERA